jgi:hypothetical protein
VKHNAAQPSYHATNGQGRRGVHRVTLVHAERSGADVHGDVEALVGVVREDGACEAVLRIVGKAQDLGRVPVRDHGQDGPEDLLAGDLHVVVDPGEHRRGDGVVAMTLDAE